MRGIRMLLLLVAMGPAWASPSLAQAGPRREAPQPAPQAGGWGKAAVMKEQARALTHKGDELYDDGKYEEAYYFYNEALQRYDAPPIAFSRALCLVKLGRLLEARAQFTKLTEDTLPPMSPREFIQAQAEASVELAKIRVRIPTLRVTVTDAPEVAVKVTVDGKDVPHLDGPIAVDPGEHMVIASAQGGEMVAKAIVVPEGKTTRLEISLLPSPLNPRRSMVPAIVALGVGTVGLVTGLVTGFLAAGEDEPGLTAASMLGLSLGGLGLGSGATLLLVRSVGHSGHTTTQSARRPPLDGAGLLLRGSF
ncbi:tetratricopeptide repeat protein [Chondromyces crocatus]|nr:tetratricopeptide repeat protein [Chondromyces crocatus]